MIESIRFRKFKRFENELIPLHENGVSFIAGGNNSGKSTILHGLAIWEFCKTAIEAEKGATAFLPNNRHQGLGLGDDEFSPINVPTLGHLWTNLSPQKTSSETDGYTLRIQCTWKSKGLVKELEFGLALSNDRLFIKATHSTLAEGDLIPRIAYLPPFAGITDHEARVPGAIKRRRIGEGLAGAVMRNTLLDLYQRNVLQRAKYREGKTKIREADLKALRQNDPWELLQQALRSNFSTELIVAPFKEEYHSHIKINIIKGKINGYKISRHPKYKDRDLMVEGSGFLQWLSVYALATDPEVDVLLLDEPDAHLHCSLQQNLIQQLIDISDKTDKQILLATHSTEILKQSEPNKILEISLRRKPRYLKEEHQKVGLMNGLGSEYSPRIDAIINNKKMFIIEGESDYRILQAIAKRVNRTWPNSWVEWISKGGHKERKQFFLALKEEVHDLIAISLRDRDDDPVNTVGSGLMDNHTNTNPTDFYCRKWRRRNIESYLIWPQAIADKIGKTKDEVDDVLREKYGIAIGDSFPDENAPDALLQIDGKAVLKTFDITPMDVVDKIPLDKIPKDIITMIDELVNKG